MKLDLTDPRWNITAQTTAGVLPIEPFKNQVLLKLSSPEPENPSIDKFFASVKRLRFQICYCSISSDCWYRETGLGPGAMEVLEDACPATPNIALTLP
jgi:hypothetical protein